jgi:hypothetical protein
MSRKKGGTEGKKQDDRLSTLGRKFGLTKQQVKKVVAEKQQILSKAPESDATAAQIRAARQGVTDLNLLCLAISEKYNEAALRTGQDARLSFPPEEVKKDERTLRSLFAKEFRFRDPFGIESDAETTIANILAGKIRKDAFESVADALQVHNRGNTVISSGTFSMKGSMRVRFKRSGVVRKRDISGSYHTTHTYIYRDGRWQLGASQMIKESDPKEFTHGHPGEEDIVLT